MTTMTTTLDHLLPRPAEENYAIDYNRRGWQDSREALEFYYDTKSAECARKLAETGASPAAIVRVLLEYAEDYNRTGYGLAGDCYERTALKLRDYISRKSRPRRRKRH